MQKKTTKVKQATKYSQIGAYTTYNSDSIELTPYLKIISQDLKKDATYKPITKNQWKE